MEKKIRILFRALVSVYSPVCYLVERSVRGMKVQSRLLWFFSLRLAIDPPLEHDTAFIWFALRCMATFPVIEINNSIKTDE
ncbi:hypothetical protein YC2023_080289 [Brassica napus]